MHELSAQRNNMKHERFVEQVYTFDNNGVVFFKKPTDTNVLNAIFRFEKSRKCLPKYMSGEHGFKVGEHIYTIEII